MKQPLHDSRVVLLGDERGLLAGRVLSDLGAEVVVVESVEGSPARSVPPLADDGSSYFWRAFAAGSSSVLADITTDAGRSTILRLIDQADFVVDSLGQGELVRHGLGWETLRKRNDRLVLGTITAFGQDGPKAHFAASDLVVWAAAGLLECNQYDEPEPVRPSVPQAFLNASLDLVDGMLLAHYARLHSGRGQLVDVSAQAALSFNTLGWSLAGPNRQAVPSGAILVGSSRPIDESGSGSGTSPALRKWRCADGLVEFHLAMGPATGRFTNNFMQWLREDGGCEQDFVFWTWQDLPSRIRTGEVTEDDIARVRTTVATFLAGKSKAEILEAAVARRVLCTPIQDVGDIASSPQLESREFYGHAGADRVPVKWIGGGILRSDSLRGAPSVGEHTASVLRAWDTHTSTRETGPRPRALTQSELEAQQQGPLTGLKVVDFSWVVAGPAVGRTLADFGAQVVRVETASRPDTARLMPPFVDGNVDLEGSALYASCNAGKLGIALDLGVQEGREIAESLVRWADVVVESFAPGRMRQWGLDYESIRALNPSVVMLSSSLLGQDGPLSGLAGFGTTGGALAGYIDLTGSPDRFPVGPFGPYTDYVAPRLGLAALLAVLARRESTGEGAYLDLAQVEAGAFLLSPELANYLDTNFVAQRRGNEDLRFTPHGVYTCQREGARTPHVAIAVETTEQWRALVGAIERPDLAADTTLDRVDARRARASELDLAIADWTSARSAAEVENVLQGFGVPAHRSSTFDDLHTDPQLGHRGAAVTVPHPACGRIVIDAPRFKLSETQPEIRAAGPMIGQHSEFVARQVLSLSRTQVTQAIETGGIECPARRSALSSSSAWKEAWQPVVDAIGIDFVHGATDWGADRIEPSSIRRFLEPLELGNLIHYDTVAAKAAGYPDIVAPASSLLSFSVPPMWRPGESTLYEEAEGQAQPTRTPINNQDFALGPPTDGFIAVSMDVDFSRPVTVGERVGRRGKRLLTCTPKESSLGRGAFLTWEVDLVTEVLEVVGRVRTTQFVFQASM